MELLIIIALVLLNGIFSMSEMSLVSSRKFKLESAKRKGVPGAKSALELAENPTKFLSTVQIGITLIGILLGIYSGENLTHDVAGFLNTYEVLKPYSQNLAVGIIVLFVTYLSILLGELLPKRLGMTFPEPIAMVLSRPMKYLSMVTSPFVWLLTSTNDLLLRIMGIKKNSDNKVTEEEIKAIIKESADGGEIQDIEQNIVQRVFELGDRRVNTLFTHRGDMVFFDTSDSWEEIIQKINTEKHSAYPVCKNNDLDDMVGIVLLKDLFAQADQDHFDIMQYVRKPVFINAATFAYNVLEIFKKEKMHYGIVVDEFGATLGIVTMDDVVDALVGDTTEYNQDEYKIVQRAENSWLVDGQYSIIEFQKEFDFNIDDDFLDKFTTVAGLLIFQKHEIPDVGDKFLFNEYELEVIDKDGQRIDKILVTKKEV